MGMRITAALLDRPEEDLRIEILELGVPFGPIGAE
jgi:hypothetical protein